ncbi:hypothetical protein [Photorhabdus sp. RM96S]|uniref:hypothetical protein n=1 Tax=Photorhabdus sp. RM96S TaxID=3342822 RepID=UPI0036D800E3
MAPTSENLVQGELQAPTLRQQIETVIRAVKGDTRQASINVCTLLEDEFGFGEKGYFDDDPELINILLDRD